MDRLLFGISGTPIGDGNQKFDYKSGIYYLKSLGLDAMELPFVRSVNITEKNKGSVLQAKLDNNFYLSAHGSYYINLNSDEPLKQEQSVERILKGAEGLLKVNGRSLIFHPGFYLSDTREETLHTIKQKLSEIPYIGVDYRLETTGKPSQFGSLEELIDICSELPHCKLCIDFSHIHARGNGALKGYKDFANILEQVGSRLGREALDDLHMHMSGINYGIKGEKNHLTFEESDFDYMNCLKALKAYEVKGCLICESPIQEQDAVLLKNFYEGL
jgi:deoxyribonuclease-4